MTSAAMPLRREAPDPASRPASVLRRLFGGSGRSRAGATVPDPAPAFAAEGTADGAAGLLRVEGLRKSYGSRTVVHEAGLTVRNGEAVGLLMK